MAQIRNFTSTNDSYFVLDGVSYPKVYEAMLDNGYTKDRVKLVGTNRDNSPLVFSTHYSNIRVDGVSFANAQESISRLNQVVFSKGGGSGGGGTTGDYIPLTGTEEGKPVTGSIEFAFPNGIDKTIFETDTYNTFNITTIWTNPDDSIINYGYANITGSNTQIGHSYNGDNGGNFLMLSSDGVMLADRNNLKGLVGEAYYGVNYDDNTYVQKIYVDKANSYSTDEVKTGGTWIDGKPIYTITQLTTDPIPEDIETQFPNIIVGSYTVYKYTKTTSE